MPAIVPLSYVFLVSCTELTGTASASLEANTEQQQQQLLNRSLQRYAPAFAFLSATSAAFAALALAAPGLLLGLALPGCPPSELAEPFVRIAGATMLLSTAVEWRLKVRHEGLGASARSARATKPE